MIKWGSLLLVRVRSLPSLKSYFGLSLSPSLHLSLSLKHTHTPDNRIMPFDVSITFYISRKEKNCFKIRKESLNKNFEITRIYILGEKM